MSAEIKHDDDVDPRNLERFAPKIAPAPVSRAMMSALADRLSLEAHTHARAITTALELVITELRAGRWDRAMFSLYDMSRAIMTLDRACDKPAATVEDSIERLDPSYHRELQAARNEISILRAGEHYRGAPASALRFALALHTKCPDCAEAQAIKRELASRKEG